jgi:LysM repeat protein
VDGLRLVAAAGSPWRRLLLPAACLLAATVAIVLVRAQLAGDAPTNASPPAAAKPAAGKAKPAREAAARFYTVKAGDTLDAIASVTGVPVARLRELNPALEPTALFIGVKIRLR